MDPMQCFNDLTSAFIAQEWSAARTHALDLLDFLVRGKISSLDRRDTQGFCRIVMQICANHLDKGNQ